jgi:hypothetical protein
MATRNGIEGILSTSQAPSTQFKMLNGRGCSLQSKPLVFRKMKGVARFATLWTVGDEMVPTFRFCALRVS